MPLSCMLYCIRYNFLELWMYHKSNIDIASSSHSQSNYRFPTGTRSTTGSSADSSAMGNTFPIPEELLRPLLPNNQNFHYKNNLQQR